MAPVSPQCSKSSNGKAYAAKIKVQLFSYSFKTNENKNGLHISKIQTGFYREWESENLSSILIKAEGGKAFCAGGDIIELTSPTWEGDYDSGTAFFREEYQLDYQIGTYPKECS